MTKLEVNGKKISQKQWDVLILWIDGQTYKDIAKELKISVDIIKQRIKTFKENFPDAYNELLNMKKKEVEIKNKLENPRSLSELKDDTDIAVGESLSWDGKLPKIVEKF